MHQRLYEYYRNLPEKELPDTLGCFIIEEGERVELTVDGMKGKFREFLDEAERLIGETGYHRRDGELAELKAWVEKAGW